MILPCVWLQQHIKMKKDPKAGDHPVSLASSKMYLELSCLQVWQELVWEWLRNGACNGTVVLKT